MEMEAEAWRREGACRGLGRRGGWWHQDPQPASESLLGSRPPPRGAPRISQTPASSPKQGAPEPTQPPAGTPTAPLRPSLFFPRPAADCAARPSGSGVQRLTAAFRCRPQSSARRAESTLGLRGLSRLRAPRCRGCDPGPAPGRACPSAGPSAISTPPPLPHSSFPPCFPCV